MHRNLGLISLLPRDDPPPPPPGPPPPGPPPSEPPPGWTGAWPPPPPPTGPPPEGEASQTSAVVQLPDSTPLASSNIVSNPSVSTRTTSTTVPATSSSVTITPTTSLTQDNNLSTGNQDSVESIPGAGGIPVWAIITMALASLAIVLALFAAVWWWRWRQLYNEHKRARQQDAQLLDASRETPSPHPSSTEAAAIKQRYLSSFLAMRSQSSIGRGDGEETPDPRRNSLPFWHPYAVRVPSVKSFTSSTISVGGALGSYPRKTRTTRSTLAENTHEEEEEYRRPARPVSSSTSEFTVSTGVLFSPMAPSEHGHHPPIPMAPLESIPPAHTGIPP